MVRSSGAGGAFMFVTFLPDTGMPVKLASYVCETGGGIDVLKNVMAAAMALALTACGGKTMIESDMSHLVAASPASPWLTVEHRGDAVLTVTGLDEKHKVQVTPDIASVVEARLRTALQPDYFTDLIINCRDLEVGVAAKTDADTPPALGLEMTVDCRIVARGLVATKRYRLTPSQPVDPATPHLDTAVAKLLDTASTELAGRLWSDVLATGVRR